MPWLCRRRVSWALTEAFSVGAWVYQCTKVRAQGWVRFRVNIEQAAAWMTPQTGNAMALPQASAPSAAADVDIISCAAWMHHGMMTCHMQL